MAQKLPLVINTTGQIEQVQAGDNINLPTSSTVTATPSPSDNSLKIATTAYVDNASASGSSTGSKLYLFYNY